MPLPLNISDEEVRIRSAYMCLFRSMQEQDAYYPEEFIPLDVADGLYAQGHIESVGAGYKLTDAGAAYWLKLANIKTVPAYHRPTRNG